MKKAYTNPKIKIAYAADIVSTSADVETPMIPFSGYGETPDAGQQNMDAGQAVAYNTSEK